MSHCSCRVLEPTLQTSCRKSSGTPAARFALHFKVMIFTIIINIINIIAAHVRTKFQFQLVSLNFQTPDLPMQLNQVVHHDHHQHQQCGHQHDIGPKSDHCLVLSVSLVEFCSNCWICQSCHMDFSKLLPRFAKLLISAFHGPLAE